MSLINLTTMKKLDVEKSSPKNFLPVGTILMQNGYSNPKYVVIKKLGGVTESGAKYLTVDIENLSMRFFEAAHLEYISDKKDNRIQVYITDEVYTPEETQKLIDLANVKKSNMEKEKLNAEKERKFFEEKGRNIARKCIPENAASLIVACNEVDESDIMTDYFHVSRGETVVLGYSMHKKDVFTEMRKHAGRIPETAHLATASNVNRSGQKKTDENKSYWKPSDEHREKYSMGRGYYLKASHCYTSGWAIHKECKYGKDFPSSLYEAIGRRPIIEKYPLCKKVEKSGDNSSVKKTDSIVIRKNESKNGLEIVFPTKPDTTILEWLKSQGFRWSRFSKLWYVKYSQGIEKIVREKLAV